VTAAAMLVLLLGSSCSGGGEGGGQPPERSPRSRTRAAEPTAPSSPAPDSPFTCTRVLGFSQTAQWYRWGFESQVDDDSWELFAYNGAGVSTWANPDSRMWTSARLYSPCAERSADPDRVVLTISDAEYRPNASAWAEVIEQAIATIRQKYPDAAEIVLQPVVGGPDGDRCMHDGITVRATFNQPFIEQAIQMVAGGAVRTGAVPQVRTCDDYRDDVGHLVPDAKGPIGAEIGAFYRGV
jgi:hypothetical protein